MFYSNNKVLYSHFSKDKKVCKVITQHPNPFMFSVEKDFIDINFREQKL